ncbi:hypothetical protein DAEQUDRAFT_769321 [Daedalea quercina L-15889]|uniref:Uncharacterized protein n=1 Tax=Daedalea quercina L-15889 TaxID=1314783 RepID=A0A165LVC7_9APHY|nr:hypothetical protein DAEQUDRAFT_769321 [Daedalea quercina L-15889]
MRFGTTLPLLFAAASVAPAVLAASFGAASYDSFEARELKPNDLTPSYVTKDPSLKYHQKGTHSHSGQSARPERQRDSRHKRDLEWVDGIWEREVDDGLWARTDLEEMWARAVEDVIARVDPPPPHYHKDDPVNGQKPKYRQKDPHPVGGHPAQRPKPKPQPQPKGKGKGSSSHKRELADYFW